MGNRLLPDPHGSRPTVSDVAKAAGVSTATVSRVVNGSTDVSDELKARVLEAVDRLGYVRDSTARALAMRRSFIAGAVLPRRTDPLTAAAFDAFEAAMESSGLATMVVRQDAGGEAQGPIRHLIEHGAEAIFLAAGGPTAGLAPLLSGRDLPFAMLDAGGPSPEGATRLRFDFASALDGLVACMAGLGHGRIGVVGGLPDGPVLPRLLLSTITDALARRGVPPVATLAIGDDVGAGRRALAAMARLDQAPTAVLCASDELALGVMMEAAARGLSVPQALSVAGCGDLPFSRHLHPALTSLAIDTAALGALGAECLLAGIERRACADELVLPTSLVFRASVGPAPAGT